MPLLFNLLVLSRFVRSRLRVRRARSLVKHSSRASRGACQWELGGALLSSLAAVRGHCPALAARVLLTNSVLSSLAASGSCPWSFFVFSWIHACARTAVCCSSSWNPPGFLEPLVLRRPDTVADLVSLRGVSWHDVVTATSQSCEVASLVSLLRDLDPTVDVAWTTRACSTWERPALFPFSVSGFSVVGDLDLVCVFSRFPFSPGLDFAGFVVWDHSGPRRLSTPVGRSICSGVALSLVRVSLWFRLGRGLVADPPLYGSDCWSVCGQSFFLAFVCDESPTRPAASSPDFSCLGGDQLALLPFCSPCRVVSLVCDLERLPV